MESHPTCVWCCPSTGGPADHPTIQPAHGGTRPPQSMALIATARRPADARLGGDGTRFGPQKPKRKGCWLKFRIPSHILKASLRSTEEREIHWCRRHPEVFPFLGGSEDGRTGRFKRTVRGETNMEVEWSKQNGCSDFN